MASTDNTTSALHAAEQVPGLNLAAIADWLRANAPDAAPEGELSAILLSGGRSNLTYGLSDGRRRLVLRRPPLGTVLETAHDMVREHRVMHALRSTRVPVPKMYGLCEDPSVTGAPFVAMEWVDGVVRRRPEDFSGMTAHLARSSAVEVVAVLAELHAVDPLAVDLAAHGRPEGYLARQLRRWQKQWEASKTAENATIDELARRLGWLLPETSDAAIVHGDYRYDNLIFADRDAATIGAVVDWELSTLGDPLADLGFLLMSWSDARGPILEGGLTAETDLGFPSRAELAELYAQRSGRSIAALDFYIALAHYKSAVIFEGIHSRHLAGHTVGDGFDDLGRRVQELAEQGLAGLVARATGGRRSEGRTGELPPQLLELRARVRSFVDEEVIPREHQLENASDLANPVMAELKQKAKDAGLWALGHPAEIGGGGLPFLDYVYINEIVGRSEAAIFALGTFSLQDSIMLQEFGSAAQRDRFLAPIVAGSAYPSVGVTEPEVAGSDPTSLRTTAVLDGDEWVISGHKWFISHANNAAFTTVMCLTDPDAPKHRRLSMIIVPTDTPGYELTRIVPTMGHTTGNHCEIKLDNVRVPRENLLGERGSGFRIAQRRLGPGRIFHCMRWLGQAQRAFDLMCDRATAREAFGKPLAEQGEVRRMIAESAAEIHAARLMTLDAARALDSGSEARVEISLIKFWGARMVHNVVDRAIQVHGALGLSADTPLERMYRDARYARVYDGPDEVHRMVVARQLLKDPATAPWSDGGPRR